MNIFIDIRPLWKRSSGIENYIYSFTSNLLRIDKKNNYFLLSNNNGKGSGLEDLADRNDRVRFVSTVISNENHIIGDIWEHIYLPFVLKKLGVDVVHGPNYLVPFRKNEFSTVVTIHDLVAFLFPDTVPKKYSIYMKFLLRNIVRYTDRIIVNANSTKTDLINILAVPNKKISVIYEGIDTGVFYPRDDISKDKIRMKFDISDDFILHVGNLEPRKNFKGIVDSFLKIRQKKGFKGLKLVLAGQRGWLYKGILKEIKEKRLGDSIIFTGYVGKDDLPALYSAARLFLFPSFYEGFGLPVLEAMACGTPVITSRCSSLPEVAGDAAILVDPRNINDITNAIERLLKDNTLRGTYINKGFKRVKEFTWEKTAKEVLEVYNELLSYRAGHKIEESF